jgi:hypothetical protein
MLIILFLAPIVGNPRDLESDFSSRKNDQRKLLLWVRKTLSKRAYFILHLFIGFSELRLQRIAGHERSELTK